MSGDKGKVVPFPGCEDIVTTPQAFAYAAVAVCAAITRVAARFGTEKEKEGDASVVADLAAAYDDLVAGTRQAQERKC